MSARRMIRPRGTRRRPACKPRQAVPAGDRDERTWSVARETALDMIAIREVVESIRKHVARMPARQASLNRKTNTAVRAISEQATGAMAGMTAVSKAIAAIHKRLDHSGRFNITIEDRIASVESSVYRDRHAIAADVDSERRRMELLSRKTLDEVARIREMVEATDIVYLAELRQQIRDLIGIVKALMDRIERMESRGTTR